MPAPSRVRVKSSRSLTIPLMRVPLFRMRDAAACCGWPRSGLMSSPVADIMMAPSGVRTSCPRMARNISFECSRSRA